MNIGQMLRFAREKKEIPLYLMPEYLREYKIKCSTANLSKIERGLISCRVDIFAALCLIYKLDPSEVLYK